VKNKPQAKNFARTTKEISEELFWKAASHARDPVGSSEITQQIDKTIREHEGNVRRKSPAS
jgi:hypothetical protein